MEEAAKGNLLHLLFLLQRTFKLGPRQLTGMPKCNYDEYLTDSSRMREALTLSV
jgi:hypothetical protein